MIFRSSINSSTNSLISFAFIWRISCQFTFDATAFLRIHNWHPKQRIELLPTPFRQTPLGCFSESLRECRFLPLIMILVLPMFTLRPFASRCYFQFPSLESNSSIVSASGTRSSAYKSSHEQLVRNSREQWWTI